jgi:CRISPR-associated protein Cmr3
MTSWLLAPRDSLMVQDGRPCYAGQSLRSLDFPWPSSLAGFIRSTIGRDPKTGEFKLTPEKARQIEVKGPLLVQFDPHNEKAPPVYYAPAPQDVLWHTSADEPAVSKRYRLTPIDDSKLPNGCAHDLQGKGLRLLDLVSNERPKGKQTQGEPFWRWDDLEAWLLNPIQAPDTPAKDFGLSQLVREKRTHVAINHETQTAEDSKLFGTEMLRFTRRIEKTGKAARYEHYALAFACDDARLKAGIGCLGGERRLSMLSASSTPLPPFPEDRFPKDKKLLRVILLTPAIFKQGFRPTDPPDATLIAAAVGRPSVISGWDMAATNQKGTKGAPKATRRMAPAGSVYWFQLNDGIDPVAWARSRWMTSLCDDEQDKRDGFGLCVVGVAE